MIDEETDVETGVVVHVEGGEITLECDPHEMCASCSAKKGCMMADNSRKRRIVMDNSIGATLGDTVLFAIDSRGIVAASLLIYLVPIVFLFIGLIIGYQVNDYLMLDKDGASALIGLLLFLISFIFIKVITGSSKEKTVFKPRALRIAEKNRVYLE